MSKAIDWTKPLEVVRATDGAVGVVLAVYHLIEITVVCKVVVFRIAEVAETCAIVFDVDGKGPFGWIVRNKPKEHAILGWLNCYPDISHAFHPTRENADQFRRQNCFACVPITIAAQEGEGLDK